ncbi:MAG: hypothetical protein IKX65_10675 [Prevotella sp.]|nr:hypothetical protein [Prevotella sp.]
MKRFLFALLLLPQLAYSQYRSDIFSPDQSGEPSRYTIGTILREDTILTLDNRSEITAISISGICVLNYDGDSYVRVTLVDDHNYEYLVYENYPLLSDELTTRFTDTAIETVMLDGVTPKCLRITMKDATLELESVNCYRGSSSNRLSAKRPEENQKEQVRYIVDRLNANLRGRNMTWRAGMTSMAEKTYEEKKAMFGGELPQLHGFEYYAGGIFVIPGTLESTRNNNTRNVMTNTYVSSWDWRTRHGKNWMTEVRDQGHCNSCWAFSAIASLEAYINLYYNDIINYDLSEEEIISCSNFGCGGGDPSDAFIYIRDSAVIDESNFQYTGFEQNCTRCTNPNERVTIENYLMRDYGVEDDIGTVKQALFNNPITMVVQCWGHSMTATGYKTIAHGDTIYLGSLSKNDSVVIDSTQHQSLIGRTAWLLKNSWNTSWGKGGYCYLVFDIGNASWISYPIGSITCINKNDADIVVSDADGDGYYFWGIHENKPLWCPGWVPDTKDGDDSDHTKGKLYLESPHIIGDLEILNPDGNTTLQITGNVTYSTRQSKYSHIRINSNATLTVQNILNLFGRVTITIESGGELVIDGGVITNADIAFSTGGKLKIKNGGKLVMRTNTDFEAPIGALVEIEDGMICKSNDF